MNYDESPYRPTPKVMFQKLNIMRQAAIDMHCCAMCGGEAGVFADEMSARDYRITGLCQSCQNDTYDTNEVYGDTGER